MFHAQPRELVALLTQSSTRLEKKKYRGGTFPVVAAVEPDDEAGAARADTTSRGKTAAHTSACTDTGGQT